jgi:hypothetical protein
MKSFWFLGCRFNYADTNKPLIDSRWWVATRFLSALFFSSFIYLPVQLLLFLLSLCNQSFSLLNSTSCQ